MRVGLAILLSDKTDSKSNTVTRNKKGYIFIKGQFIKQYNNNKYMCTNNRIPRYMNQTLKEWKGEIVLQ